GNLSRHTLVMLDNVPLNPNGEPFDLSSLPLKNIRHIEIVKGNASLYGGASAIGGIVYLFTDTVQTPFPLKLQQSFALGSFNQLRQEFGFEQQSPLHSYKVLISHLSADNDFTYKPRPWWNLTGKLTRGNNRKEQQNVALQISSNPEPFSFKYTLDVANIYRQLPGPVNFLDIYTNAYLTGQNLRHSLSFGAFRNNFSNQLLLWQNHDETQYTNTRAANPVYPTQYRQKQTSQGLKNQAAYSFRTISADLVLENSEQSYERNDLLYPELSVDSVKRSLTAGSIKAKTTNEFDLLTNQLQAGVRLDKVSDFDCFVSWRLEEMLSYDGLVQMQAGAALGTGFSLPSFYDLYWKGDAQSLGNPDLEPETSIGGNVWLAIIYTNYSVKAAWHKNQVEKLIQWRQTYLYGTAWKPVNIGKAGIQNWEFSAEAVPFNWLALKSSLTLTNARDENLDTRLTYTPTAKWTANLVLTCKNSTLNLSRDYTGRQWKTADNTLDPIPAFTLYGAGLSYFYSYKKLQTNLGLQLNNLFDSQYEIYDYVPQPGFNWQSGITLTLAL
ncbi:MAG: TonB-dependent receptor, partial [Candidatus Cloacimonadaceae bacterium]